MLSGEIRSQIDITRPVLLAHDLGFNGASIALLHLAQSLDRLGHPPVVFCLHDGPLRILFDQIGIPIVKSVNRKEISFAIANTAVQIERGLKGKVYGINTAIWIHETKNTLSMLKLDLLSSGIDRFDLIAHPALFQRQEMIDAFPDAPVFQLRNHVIQPYFRLPTTMAAFAMVGSYENRKGQDRLLSLVRESSSKCNLLFVGASQPTTFSPSAAGCTWQFTGKIPPDDAKKAIASCDGLISCSTEEVQPLAVIEALMAGRPVLLSDIKAHRELADVFSNAFLFDRESASSFARGLAKLVSAKNDLAGAATNRELGLRLFGEKAFDERVSEMVAYLLSKSRLPNPVAGKPARDTAP
jgi:glycosyltransferase involved in cell wall biosynthesis